MDCIGNLKRLSGAGRAKAKGLAACDSQTTSPLDCINMFPLYFYGSLQYFSAALTTALFVVCRRLMRADTGRRTMCAPACTIALAALFIFKQFDDNQHNHCCNYQPDNDRRQIFRQKRQHIYPSFSILYTHPGL